MVKGKKLFTLDEIEYLKSLYDRLPSTFHDQDVNLFHIHKTNINGVTNKHWDLIQQKLFDFHGRKSAVTNYFLQYVVGSYAKMHLDNPKTVDGTAITLLEKSDDLEGGDIITVGGNKERKIIPQSVGETIYYDTAVVHGVSKVTQGSRKVLITWFRKDTWQK